MTAQEIIARLKAEVNKLPEKYKGMYKQFGNSLGFIDGLDEVKKILSDLEKECEDFPTTDEEMAKFLATHPKAELPERYKTPDWMFEKSEKPSEGLEEEIREFVEQEWDGLHDNDGNPLYTADCLEYIARHFAQWGAEHRGSSEIPNDIGEAAMCFSKNASDGHNYRDLRVGFIAGAKWQAEQDQETIELAEDHAYLAGAVNEREKMLREAVVAHCYGSANTASELGSPGHCISICYNEKENTPHVVAGDQVKLFIVKED